MGLGQQSGLKPDACETVNAHIRISLKHTLFGFFIAAYYGLLTSGNYPAALGQTSLWLRELVLLLPIFGAILSALILIALSRIPATFLPQIHLVLSLASITSVVASSCFIVLWFIPTNLILAVCALLVAGLLMPVGLYLWITAYKTLPFRQSLLNSAFAFLIYALLSFLTQRLFSQFSLILHAIFLAIGFSSLFLFKDVITSTKVDVNPAKDGDSGFRTSLFTFLISLPITGIALYAATVGLTFAVDSPPLLNESITVCIAAAIFIFFATRKNLRNSERNTSFLLFNIILPSLAVIALFIKVIPIDFVSHEVFREFNILYFQVLSLAAWTFSVYTSRHTRISPALSAGMMQVIIGFMLLIGYFIQSNQNPWEKGFLGMMTAAFLLYATIVLGRSIILYSKGPDLDEGLGIRSENIVADCDSIGKEYKLTPREIEVLKELAYGHASSYIAEVLCISNNTVRSHMKNIYKKLGISSRQELIVIIWKR